MANKPIETVDIDLKIIVDSVNTDQVDKKIQEATDQLKFRSKNKKISLGAFTADEALGSVRGAIEQVKDEMSKLDKKADGAIRSVLDSRIKNLTTLTKQLESLIREQVKAADQIEAAAIRAANKPSPTPKVLVTKEPIQEVKPHATAIPVSALAEQKFELSQNAANSEAKRIAGLRNYLTVLDDVHAKNLLVFKNEEAENAQRIAAAGIISHVTSELKTYSTVLGTLTGKTPDALTAFTAKTRELNAAMAQFKASVTSLDVKKSGSTAPLDGDAKLKALKDASNEADKLLKLAQSIRQSGGTVDTSNVEDIKKALNNRIVSLTNTLAAERRERSDTTKIANITNALHAIPNSPLSGSERLAEVKKLDRELTKIYVDAAKFELITPKNLASLKEAGAEAKKIIAQFEKASHIPEVQKATKNVDDLTAQLKKNKQIREAGAGAETPAERLAQDSKEYALLQKIKQAKQELISAITTRYTKELGLYNQQKAAYDKRDVATRGEAPVAPVKPNLSAINSSLRETSTRIHDLSQQLNGFEVLWNKVTQGIGLFFRYAVVYKALGGISSLIGGSVNELVDLDKQLVSIKAIANATSSEMDGVTASVLHIGETSYFTSGEVAKAAETLVQAGVKIGSLNAVLRSTADLAAATGAGLQQAAELNTTFISVYQDVSPDEIADSLKSAVNISKLSIADLSTIGNYLLSSGTAFNEDYKDILAVSATLRNAGIKASTIATGSRQALLELLNPDTKALKGLKARYAAIGRDVSEDTIKALFQGFKGARDPLAAALAELGQLGFDKLGSGELSRVFDVRSENIIRTLVQQQSALKANRVQLDDAGSAAEGAKTQLESLSASASNLREVLIGGLFQSSESFIGKTAKEVTSLTKYLEDLIKKMRDLKADTGSTGFLPAVGATVAAAGGALLARKSIGTTLASATIAGGTVFAERLNHKKGDTEDKGAGFSEKAVYLVTLYQVLSFLGKIPKSFLSVFSSPEKAEAKLGLAGRNVQGVVERSARITGLISRLGSSILGAGRLLLSTFNPWALGITAIVSASVFLIGKFGKQAEESNQVIQDRVSAIQQTIEDNKTLIDDLKKNKDIAQSKEEATKGFTTSIDDLYHAITEVTGGRATGLVEDLIAKAGVVSKEIGSKSLEELAAQVEAITKNPVDRSKLAAALQKRDDALAVAEAVRSQAVSSYRLALAKQKDGSPTLKDNATVKAFDTLTQAEKSLLTGNIVTVDQIEKLAAIKPKLDKLFGEYTESAKVIEDLAKKQSENVDLELQKAQAFLTNKDETGKLKPEALSSLKLLALEQVAAGADDVVKGIFELSKGLISESLVEAAKQNKNRKGLDEYRKLLSETQDKIAAPVQSLPKLDEFVKRPLNTIQPNTEGDALREQVKASRIELAAATQAIVAKLEAGTPLSEQDTATARIRSIKEELATKEARLSAVKDGELESALTTEGLNRSLILSESKIKDIQKRLSNTQETKLVSSQAEVDLVQEMAAIKKKQLAVEKDILSKQLILELKKEGQDATGKTPEELLNLLSKAKGQELVTSSSGVAEKYKGLLDVVDREKQAREEQIKNLNNIKVRTTEAKIKGLEDVKAGLDTAARTAESKLEKATSDLTAARTAMAKTLEDGKALEERLAAASLSASSNGQGKAVSRGELDTRALAIDSKDAALALIDQIIAAKEAGSINASDAQSRVSSVSETARIYQQQEEEQSRNDLIVAQNNQTEVYTAMVSAQNQAAKVAEEIASLQLKTQEELTVATRELTSAIIGKANDQKGSSEGKASDPTDNAKAALKDRGLSGSDFGGLQTNDGGFNGIDNNRFGDSTGLGGSSSTSSGLQPTKFSRINRGYSNNSDGIPVPTYSDSNLNTGLSDLSSLVGKLNTNLSSGDKAQLQPLIVNVGAASFKGQGTRDDIIDFNNQLLAEEARSGWQD
jgi:TP901 family phage tail tape measure protein